MGKGCGPSEGICLYADEDGTDYNPFRNLRHQLMTTAATRRPALIDPVAVAKLFRDIAKPFPGRASVTRLAFALRFTALTAARPGNIQEAEWTRIRSRCGSLDDLSREMTMKHEHIVPLSRQAVAILRLAHAITGKVFSCRRDEPISDMTLNRRLKALGYDTSGEHTAHGFRTTFSTLLNGECDRDGRKTWDGDLIELQLAHLDDSSVKAIYNRTGPMSLIIARAKMMQHWADRIDTMRDGSNVLPLNPKRNVA